MTGTLSAATTGEPLLVVEHAHHAYLDRYAALVDVSLTVRRGERVALVGANGCGKSTLLKLLDGLVFPSAGAYRAFGVEITEAALDDDQLSQAFRSRVGFVFQSSDAQVFSPTVREEIAFGPLHMGLGRDEIATRVGDVLRMLDIESLADRAPFQLSAGQKKRVAIASVLAMNPDVLLFDEPTAALDPRTQQWLIELVGELHEAGKTIVIATHDLDVLELLADRCVVLGEDHRVAADATPREILADRALLHRVNLLHEHTHRHGSVVHRHEHGADHHRDADHHG